MLHFSSFSSSHLQQWPRQAPLSPWISFSFSCRSWHQLQETPQHPWTFSFSSGPPGHHPLELLPQQSRLMVQSPHHHVSSSLKPHQASLEFLRWIAQEPDQPKDCTSDKCKFKTSSQDEYYEQQTFFMALTRERKMIELS